nr:ribonuclease III domain-containing protein [Myxosarcina sp. GI1]
MNLPDSDYHKMPFDSVRAWANINNMANLTAEKRFVQIERLSPLALAYIGDAVYELYVRTFLLMPPKRMADYHNLVIRQVKAEAQAAKLEILEPYLTALEKDILRRGRNACRVKPKRLTLKVYQQATSFETLIGYLYLTDFQRLQELLAKLKSIPKIS